MSTVTRILLEEPFWLALAAGPALFVLWGIWNRTRTRAAGRSLLAGLLITPLLFVIQELVRTDREKLVEATRQLSSAVERGDIGGIVALIDPEAAVSGVGDREAFKSAVTSLLESYTIQDNSIFDVQIRMERSGATLTCRARCTVKTARFTQPVLSQWRLEFEMKRGRCLITDVAPLNIAGMHYGSIGEIPLGSSGL